MQVVKKWKILLSAGLLLCCFVLPVAVADDDDREHSLGSVDNPTYKEHCGACHLAYPPALLPSGSWQLILSDLENHNGISIELDEEAGDVIRGYLEENAAEHSRAKRARKIMRSLKGETPSRITEIPYIRRKHHDVSPDVFKRESIGSFSNCLACHKTAKQGIFDDDHVSIPK